MACRQAPAHLWHSTPVVTGQAPSGLPMSLALLTQCCISAQPGAACPHTFEFCFTLEARPARPWAAWLAFLRSRRVAFFTPGSRQHVLLSAAIDAK